MKKENGLASGLNEKEVVDNFMLNLKHPLADVVEYLREFILSCGKKKISEGIFWNAPTFYYAGKMKPFNPKEYKRYIVGFNLFKQDAVRLIFLRGASVNDPTNLLEGEYKDGRRLITFTNIADVKQKEKAFSKIILDLLKTVDK